LIYREFILELRHSLSKDPDQPVPVYPFAYDWRQPLHVTEDRLEAVIQEVIDRTSLMRHYFHSSWIESRKVHLVGHSMGGLIISGLLARKPHVGQRVARVATLGTPYRGSIEAVAKICMGTSALDPDGSSSREREAARITPALYHLLPSFNGAVKEGVHSLYSPAGWQFGVIETLTRYLKSYSVKLGGKATQENARELLADLLAPAADHRQRLESLSAPPGGKSAADWLVVVGVSEKTRTHINVGSKDGAPYFEFPSPKARSGDGTVPIEGAVPSFLSRNNLVAVTKGDFALGEIGQRLLAVGTGLHAALPSMNLVQRIVVSHLQGKQEGGSGGMPMPGVKKSDWQPPGALSQST
ncbi:MAG: esterase/lipase family protein, partial [Lysobacteraceae bacterium]